MSGTYKGLRIQARPETHEKCAEILGRLLPAGSPVLDFAAGQGALTQRLLDLGYRVSCTSWNGKLKVAAEAFRVDLEGDFCPCHVGGRYPAVLCIEIIEHLQNPLAFLRKAREVVQDDGFLILSTPNVESALARLQILARGYPLSFSGEEVTRNGHISILGSQTLDWMLRIVGLRAIERHFLPKERFPWWSPKGITKNAVLSAIRLLAHGDTEGTTRLYVLQRSEPTKAFYY